MVKRSAQPVDEHDMRTVRLVVAALILAGVVATVAQSGTTRAAVVPPQEQIRMLAIATPFAYLPGSLPHGLIYINWSWDHPGGVSCPNRITVTFAGASVGQVVWSSYWSGCVAGDQFPPPKCNARADRTAHISGRVVRFMQGNYSSEVWMCFRIPAASAYGQAAVAIPAEVYAAVQGLTPAAAMRMVASARPA
jgi:hypothetical protein